MRLTTVILLCGFMQLSAASFGQRITINKKDVALESILKEIRKQSGFDYYTDAGSITSDMRVSIRVENANLDETLTAALRDLPLVYEISDRYIVLKKKPDAGFIGNLLSRVLSVDVKGRVVDSVGNGLAGANVRVKNGKISTTTDNNGDFLLKNVDENGILLISYLGFISREVKVNPEFNYIQLIQSTSKLDEIQIQAYGKTSKRLNTGTISTIKASDIAGQNMTNPLMALQGRVPNLAINPSGGLPNSPITLQLRGQNSLSMNAFGQRVMTQPLIVVDGVPYENNISSGAIAASFGSVGNTISMLSMVNVNDIEQIDVLTDADATSIYGSRGGNGVILITTKRGKAGKTSVNASVLRGWSEVPRKLELMNTAEYLQMRKEAYTVSGLPVPDRNLGFKNFSNYDLTVWDQDRYTDWQEEFLGGTAPVTSASLSISGGSQAVQYLLSGNYNNSRFLFPGEDKNESGGMNINLNTLSSNGKLKAFLNGAYSFVNSLSPSSDLTRLAVVLAPNAPALYTPAGDLNWEPDPADASGIGSWNNPFSQLEVSSRSRQNAFRANTDLSYQFLPNLSVKLSGGFSQFFAQNLSITPSSSFDPTDVFSKSSGAHNHVITCSLTMDPQISYNTYLGKGKLDVFMGASYQRQQVEGETSVGFGFASDNLLESLEYAGSFSGTNYSTDYRYIAFSGRLGYNWENKYLINVTARRDGSSRFGLGNQFGNFWSVGSAWIFSEAEVVKAILPALSFGKIRGSYGTSGNDGIGDYQFIELYQRMGDNRYQDIGVIRSNGSINPDYHWESIKKLEIGLEAGLFKDRILFGASYWRTRSSDQLGFYPLPSTAGGQRIVRNQDAWIQNAGWDFSLQTKIISSKVFSWSSSFNFGIQNSKLLSKPESLYDNFGLDLTTKVGEPFSGFAVVQYEYRGVNPLNGLYQFSDRAGNVTTSLDNQVLVPHKRIDIRPLTLGVGNTLSYKGISLDFFFQLTAQNGKNYLLDEAYSSFATNLQYGSFSSLRGLDYGNLPRELLNHWRNPGDIVPYQKLSVQGGDDTAREFYVRAKSSDLAWTDASFIRLRSVSLSYRFPAKLVDKIGLKGGRVYLQGQNLLTITGYKGLDPETQSVTVLPLLRTVSAGLQVEF